MYLLNIYIYIQLKQLFLNRVTIMQRQHGGALTSFKPRQAKPNGETQSSHAYHGKLAENKSMWN